MPYISDKTIEKIKQRLSIVDVISEYVKLKKSGHNYSGLCPFHIEKTPSFFVNNEKGVFHCFGCGESGNMFSFIMKIENVSFTKSVEILAKKAGIEIEFKEGQYDSINKEKELIYKVNQEAMFIYHYYLKFKPEAEKAREYLKKREIEKNIIELFNLGYSPSEPNKIYNELVSKKYSPSLILKAGLINKSPTSDNYYDRFKDRLIFPIKDINENVIGFGARILSENLDLPKYINTPETIVFQKRSNLYGLNLAKEYIRETKEAIIVEGYFDVITLFQNDIKNVVAPLGTSLTEEQILLLKRYADTIIIIYDADEAGSQATIRSISMLLNTNLNIKIVELPKGYDPDTYVKKYGKDELKNLIKRAPSFLKFIILNSFKKYDRKTLSGKKKIIEQVFYVISKMDDEIKKDEVIRFLSIKLAISENALRKEYENYIKKGKIDSIKINNIKSKLDTVKFSERAIALILLEHPEYIKSVYNLLNLSELTDEVAQKLLSFIYESYEKSINISIDKIFELFPDSEVKSFITEQIVNRKLPKNSLDALNEHILKIKIFNINKQLKSLKEALKNETRFDIVKKIESDIQRLYLIKLDLIKNKNKLIKLNNSYE